MSGFDIFAEAKRITSLHAYAVTGDKSHLEGIEKMGFNDPQHLPKPIPANDPLAFDIYDDALMAECIGGKITKPVQALLITLSQWDTIPQEELPTLLKLELLKLRAAVKEEFNAL